MPFPSSATVDVDAGGPDTESPSFVVYPTTAPASNGAARSAPTFGPLAVAKGDSGDLAVASGVLLITDRCTFLELQGHRTLLVWPGPRTSWDPLTGTITFKKLDGQD